MKLPHYCFAPCYSCSQRCADVQFNGFPSYAVFEHSCASAPSFVFPEWQAITDDTNKTLLHDPYHTSHTNSAICNTGITKDAVPQLTW